MNNDACIKYRPVPSICSPAQTRRSKRRAGRDIEGIMKLIGITEYESDGFEARDLMFDKGNGKYVLRALL